VPRSALDNVTLIRATLEIDVDIVAPA